MGDGQIDCLETLLTGILVGFDLDMKLDLQYLTAGHFVTKKS